MHGRREEGEQVLRLRHLALEGLPLFLEPGEYPLLEAAHVDFHPVLAPVDRFPDPTELRAIVFRELRPELARVLALEDEAFAGGRKGRKRSQVVSSIASCRSTLSSAWSARASNAVVCGAPQDAPWSAMSLRMPFAAARKNGVLETK